MSFWFDGIDRVLPVSCAVASLVNAFSAVACAVSGQDYYLIGSLFALSACFTGIAAKWFQDSRVLVQRPDDGRRHVGP